MIAKLEFNLPEEQHEFDLAVNSVTYYAIIDDIRQHIRSKLKYENVSKEVEKELIAIRDYLTVD